jgi:hypothetical protein
LLTITQALTNNSSGQKRFPIQAGLNYVCKQFKCAHKLSYWI